VLFWRARVRGSSVSPFDTEKPRSFAPSRVVRCSSGLKSIARVVVGVHYSLDIAVGVAIGCLAEHWLVEWILGIANSRLNREVLSVGSRSEF